MKFHVEHALAVVLVVAAGPCLGQKLVDVPAGDLTLKGYLFEPAGDGPFPAIVMLHGCSGLYDASGRPTASYRWWARHFQALGYATLLLDSFGPRGEREICTQQDRRISELTDRPEDAYAASAWLANRTTVDPARIHLMGWSNGATAALQADRYEVAAARPGRFKSVIAYYPGCEVVGRSGYRPAAPLLILAGGADDWTPAAACRRLAAAADTDTAPIDIEVYPNAHHGFDRLGTGLRYRPEVRNRSKPGGRGATVGPDPEAREQSIRRATEFFARP